MGCNLTHLRYCVSSTLLRKFAPGLETSLCNVDCDMFSAERVHCQKLFLFAGKPSSGRVRPSFNDSVSPLQAFT
jgi:hypothetical protein